MSLHDDMVAMGDRAVGAARALAGLSARRKNSILEAMAAELEARRDALIAANALDVAAAEAAGISGAMLDRLKLTPARLEGMARGLRDVVILKDPVGHRISRWVRPNGLEIHKIRVPIGVIAIIYEARPNVTADAAGLCIKTGNAVILRGGSEARHSNLAVAEALQAGGRKKGLPEHAVQLVATTDRDAVRELVQLEGRVDLAIPRGGEGLIRAVVENARVPVIKHYKGVCHIYVDAAADAEMALRIIENAKCQRPGVCNAVEKVLIHERIAGTFLPRMADDLKARGVELRGDEAACRMRPELKPATEADWTTEYLDLVLTVKIVPSLAAAIAHINTYGSHHSDAIITADEAAGRRFTQDVDSATVYVNASTRFTDGGEFGMGAEIGISTDKLHARGPMGLEEMTTYKFVIHGTGQIRD
jgi:glutamate-5-semialdehyde dehydrogenase